jgi:ferredoxin-NADP reductase
MSMPVKIPATVREVIHHTDCVCTLSMIPQKRCPRFKPGQFLHLAIDSYDPSFAWPESRVFSIESSPTRTDEIHITYAVKGRYTRRMFDEIKENDTVWLKFPYGQFTFAENSPELVLIAGGTGITPFLSFLAYAQDMGLKTPIRLSYGVRTDNLILFQEQLDQAAHSLPDYNYTLYIENPIQGLTARKGILDISAILNECSHPKEADFYLSGPVLMINIFKDYLLSHQINVSQIHIDEWE